MVVALTSQQLARAGGFEWLALPTKMGDYRREHDWRDDRAHKRRREDPLACHNCGERGHLAKDCLSTHGKEIKDKVLVKDRRFKPRVIGTGGGVIKGLEQELGVRLKVEDVVRDDPDQGFYVRISGPGLDEVCRAVTRLEKLVAEVEAEQRGFEERRAQYQQQLTDTPAVPATLTPEAAPQPLGVALNAALQASGALPGRQQFQSGGVVPQRFGGGGAQRPSGMTSLRHEYAAAMNAGQGIGAGQVQGVYDYGMANLSQGGDQSAILGRTSDQGASFGQGLAPDPGPSVIQGMASGLTSHGGGNYNQGPVPDQNVTYNQGVAPNYAMAGNQGATQSLGAKAGQRFQFDQAGTAAEQNMEMSPDRKDTSGAGTPPVAVGSIQQPANPANLGIHSVSPNYPTAPVGSAAMNGPGLGGAGYPGTFLYGDVQSYPEQGAQGGGAATTLDELETRNIAEYLELAKQQMFEEDEEINRHRQRMREIQDYFQLRLSSLRQKQSQQRETFLILETQQRPQQQLQQFQPTRGGNGSVNPQQSQDKPLSLGLSGQYGLGNSSWGPNADVGASGVEGRQGYGSI
ncbi:hypothetical protein KFL_000670070 [Klebsormidium nitens]|uniref:CCHC-type domain-containing protein n=1 Tax=Klebsormidium nitens TaxID=105231 RepID=A0A1Y1HUU0_KLENI|nr:hypothetical protein KFL_000670070 [Klebsormidium nitens]|eukprot:GAQ80949.1 hypothetical protein KFL_000670070 [Klebsormidium nitens]